MNERTTHVQLMVSTDLVLLSLVFCFDRFVQSCKQQWSDTHMTDAHTHTHIRRHHHMDNFASILSIPFNATLSVPLTTPLTLYLALSNATKALKTTLKKRTRINVMVCVISALTNAYSRYKMLYSIEHLDWICVSSLVFGDLAGICVRHEMCAGCPSWILCFIVHVRVSFWSTIRFCTYPLRFAIFSSECRRRKKSIAHKKHTKNV